MFDINLNPTRKDVKWFCALLLLFAAALGAAAWLKGPGFVVIGIILGVAWLTSLVLNGSNRKDQLINAAHYRFSIPHLVNNSENRTASRLRLLALVAEIPCGDAPASMLRASSMAIMLSGNGASWSSLKISRNRSSGSGVPLVGSFFTASR